MNFVCKITLENGASLYTSDVGNCVSHIELAKKYNSRVKIDFSEFWFKDIIENVEFVRV